MNDESLDHCQEQPLQVPVQLALNVLVERGSCKGLQREPAELPSIESHEHALLRDAQAHWRAVDRLARNLRKRASVSRRTSASRWNKRSNTQTSVQKTLWMSVESNDSCGPEQSHQTHIDNIIDNIAARNSTMVSSDPGLEICRHLVAALRLQHEQDQLRQANLDEKKSA